MSCDCPFFVPECESASWKCDEIDYITDDMMMLDMDNNLILDT